MLEAEPIEFKEKLPWKELETLEDYLRSEHGVVMTELLLWDACPCHATKWYSKEAMEGFYWYQ